MDWVGHEFLILKGKEKGRDMKQGELFSHSAVSGWTACYGILHGHTFSLWVEDDPATPGCDITSLEPTMQLNMERHGVLPMKTDERGFVIANQLHSFAFRGRSVEEQEEWVSAFTHAHTPPAFGTESQSHQTSTAVGHSVPPAPLSAEGQETQLKKRLRALAILSQFPTEGIPSISVETVNVIKKLEKEKELERWEQENQFLAKHPSLKIPYRIAGLGVRFGKIAGRLGIETGMRLLDGIGSQYLAWQSVFEKQEFMATSTVSTAILSAELSGLIYGHLGYTERLVDTFDVFGHIFQTTISSDSTDLPFWMLLMNQTEHRLYLVFRGTENTIDSLVDANAQLVEVKLRNLEFRAHRGCYELLSHKVEELRPLIYECYRAHPDGIGITFTGHSLGGAYAALFYLFLLGDGFIKPEHMECFTFGAPAVIAPAEPLLDRDAFEGWEGLMGQYECNVHNFVNRFDIVPRALGSSAEVRLFEVIANMKGDVDVMARYREVTHGTDFIFNTSHYQPYGEFYFLYSEPKHKLYRLIKADNLPEKRVVTTMPLTKAFRVRWMVSDHFIVNYISVLTQCLKHCQQQPPEFDSPKNA